MAVQIGPAAGKNGPQRPRAVPASGVWDADAHVWRDGVYWYDENAADSVVRFFADHVCFTDAEWAGKPFVLEPWQEHDIIRPMFGWKRADGTRRYRRVFVWVPRKNGKTELAAGIALALLLGDGEIGGQVYSIASSGDQAKIVFNKAVKMCDLSPGLSDLQCFTTSIYDPELGAAFKPLTGRATGKHGLSMSGLVGDEVHEWTDGDLYQFVHDSTDARRQPMEFLISTAGKKGTFGETLWDECIAIRDGLVDDPETLVVIYAASEDDDWTDPEVWAKANPNLGVSKKLDKMEANCRRARQLPRLVNAFKNYQLNIWTDQATVWLPMKAMTDSGREFGWDMCTGPTHWRDLDKKLADKTCFGGVDLSATNDLSALAWWFPIQEGLETPAVIVRFFKPKDLLKDHGNRDKLNYEQWAKDGALIATEGNVVDYAFIRQQIYEDAERFQVAFAGSYDPDATEGGIAIDRWNATETAIKLMDEGLPVVKFGQGFGSMNAPSKNIESLVLKNGLHHGGHPILRQHAKVVAVKTNETGDIKPVKAKPTQRIDGIVAMIMANGISAGGIPQPDSTPWDDDPEFSMVN